MSTRKEFEAAIGAIITRFNDVEIALITLIGYLVGDRVKGETIGWTVGFNDKVRIVSALMKNHPRFNDHWSNYLEKTLKIAQKLSEIRNQVAHVEMWENPFDDTIEFRKATTRDTKKGYVIQHHSDWTPEFLLKQSEEIAATAHALSTVSVIFEFDPVE